MIVAGVDPGATGAIFVLDTETRAMWCYDMPTVTYVDSKRRKLQRVDPMLVERIMVQHELVHGRIDVSCVEKVGAMAKQGLSSTFAFGRAAGIVEGVMAAHSADLIVMRPQEWQPLARVKGGEHIKDNARERAQQLFPERAEWFKLKKHSGRADAALIAYATAIKLGGFK